MKFIWLFKILLQPSNLNYYRYFNSSSNFENFIPNLLNSVFTEQLVSETQVDDSNWIGKRITNEILATKDIKKDISYEIIYLKFYSNCNYHQYSSWKEKMNENYSKNSQNIIMHEKGKNELFSSSRNLDSEPIYGIIPKPTQERNLLRPMSYSWHWESTFYQKLDNQLKLMEKYEYLASRKQKKPESDLKFITSLQNLKFEAKKNLKVEEIANLLVKFEFVEELMKEHLGISKG